jgi:hypothetical protein
VNLSGSGYKRIVEIKIPRSLMSRNEALAEQSVIDEIGKWANKSNPVEIRIIDADYIPF